MITPINPSAPFAPGTAIALGITLLGVDLPSPPTPWAERPARTAPAAPRPAAPACSRPRPARARRCSRPSPAPTWGLHLTDANIALGNLVDLVGRQSAEYAKR